MSNETLFAPDSMREGFRQSSNRLAVSVRKEEPHFPTTEYLPPVRNRRLVNSIPRWSGTHPVSTPRRTDEALTGVLMGVNLLSRNVTVLRGTEVIVRNLEDVSFMARLGAYLGRRITVEPRLQTALPGGNQAMLGYAAGAIGPATGIESVTLEQEFETHYRTWKEQTRLLSDPEQIVLHPSYQRIIALGRAVLPLIFEQLKRKADLWFWALNVLTGADPVTEDELGDRRAMRDAWLAWAKRNGYIGDN